MRKRWLFLTMGLGGAALLLATLPLRPQGSDPVPVLEARRRDFAHRVSAEGYLREVKSTSLLVPEAARDSLKIAWLVDEGARVRAGDPVVRFDPTDIERTLVEGEADRATVESRIARAQIYAASELRNLERDVEEARLGLEAARRFRGRDPSLFSRLQILSDGLDEALAQQREEHAVSARTNRETVSRSEIELLAISRRKTVHDIERSQRVHKALVLTAPHDGIVLLDRDSKGNLPRVGEPAWPGDVIARIPRLDAMEAEVLVLEADAGGLAVGRPAEVRIEAAPEVVYPARVRKVDSLPKPRIRGLPLQFFAVILELEQTDPAVMKPGQRLRATLLLAERQQVLAIPRQAIFDRGGRKVVFRRRGGEFETVTVTVAEASPSRVVVESGIEEGDLLALRDPTRSPDELMAAGGGRAAAPGGGAPGRGGGAPGRGGGAPGRGGGAPAAGTP